MKIESLVVQFCQRRVDGERLLIEAVTPAEGGIPAKALGRYVEGEKAGTRTRCDVTDLIPLGFEIPKEKPTVISEDPYE